MSGQDVPYQLRTNKHVERQLFLDILDFVRIWNGPSRYLYVSMGGKFLEDFRFVNRRFAVERMISLESEAWVVKRQLFNRPFGFLNCQELTCRDFVSDYDRIGAVEEGTHAIIWFDYAAANERRDQLEEAVEQLRQLKSGDVFKITLNANWQSATHRNDFSPKRKGENDFHKILKGEYEEQLEGFLPHRGVTKGNFSPSGFSRLLSSAVGLASVQALEVNGLRSLPLGIFRYQDGPHQMLTVTLLVCDDDLRAKAESDPLYKEWGFRPKKFDSVKEIAVPQLSRAERKHIDALIVASGQNPVALHAAIPFQLAEDPKESLGHLKNYLRHYRRYPSFVLAES